MEAIRIDATVSTPAVLFEPEQNLLRITGESYPENVLLFYEPILAAISAHLSEPDAGLVIEFHVRYLNTSSVKAVMDILDLAEEAYQSGRKTAVIWRYDPEDDRSLDIAEEFSEDLSLPFTTEAVDGGGYP
ncbi:DUF1987 domain-containing protein [Desulfobotulus sp.]|jgi:hypothetical protein|uniref:DUF1987 domain-containing protein n=1 Tax=Desulfobotulus sp. TaxID=1940337 RepID=UPI002A364935|nr:DUF1987 domain-containing protein [Desulfobotulus sp.]MDY0162431.1 DUF1987 domain-containing protein [Desulfobotulus sp.]